MRVAATRTLSALAANTALLILLFVAVVLGQSAAVAAMRSAGYPAPLALTIASAGVLILVFGGGWLYRAFRKWSVAHGEAVRLALGLPEGPCCVVWRGGPEAEWPWQLEGEVHARYPRLARRYGIEGFALVDFEIGVDGVPKNLHCIDCWPSALFYESAAAALRKARFRPRGDASPRFGPSYRAPFVFRIKGATNLAEYGWRARSGKLAGAFARAWEYLVLRGLRFLQRP
jgi:TonB family protein